MKFLVFAGAGCSVELGVPAMRQMALELLAHIGTAPHHDTFLRTLHQRIEEANADLETVIEDIDRICDADLVLPAYGAHVDAALIDSARLTRAEIEWFVQHSCERVRADAAAAMWGPLVQRTDDNELTIATTNYDRGVELACQHLAVKITDGFDVFEEKEWANWVGFEELGTRLLKLHGSTDWYQVRETSAVVKLRHPMPLFGGVSLQLETAGLGALGSALVLPSREKRKNVPPFPLISHEFFASAKSTDVAVFVGTSLRDPDLRAVVQESAGRIPTIVVGPDLTFEAGMVPEGAAIVKDFASSFLSSTLPGMIASETFPAPGSETGPIGDVTPRSVLQDMVAITDPGLPEDDKCLAIESLWRRSVSLGDREIGRLLNDGAGRVARDALALVPLSRVKEELMIACTALAESTSDSGFKDDVALLVRMANATGSSATSDSQ